MFFIYFKVNNIREGGEKDEEKRKEARTTFNRV